MLALARTPVLAKGTPYRRAFRPSGRRRRSGWFLMLLSRRLAPRGDRIGDGERLSRHVGVQKLDHPPVELDHALAGVLRQRERRDDGGGAFDLSRGGSERLVADVDLARVDQRLAVEPHVAALQTFVAEAVEIRDVVEDAVDDVDAVGARGDHAG